MVRIDPLLVKNILEGIFFSKVQRRLKVVVFAPERRQRSGAGSVFRPLVLPEIRHRRVREQIRPKLFHFIFQVDDLSLVERPRSVAVVGASSVFERGP